MGGFPSSCYKKSYVVLIYSYNNTEVSEPFARKQCMYFFSAMKNVSCALAFVFVFVFVQWQQAGGQRWSPMLKSICCNCPTCDCYCIAGKDRPGGVGLYKGQQFYIDKRKVVGMQKLFIQNDKLPKPSTQTNIKSPLRVFWWT